MSKLYELPAHVLLALYASGQASPVDCTREVLERIGHLNPLLNAFCFIDEQGAIESARESETRWLAWRKQRETGFGGANAPRALEGVPVSIKDLLDVKGVPTRHGSAIFADNPPAASDDITVARLRAAGAIPLGKTNVPPALADLQSNNPVYGRTHNAVDQSRVAGGSSGGSAYSRQPSSSGSR